MKITGKFILALGFACLCSAFYAQSEKSVEDTYFSDMDGVVILSLAQSDEYDNKLVAMQYIESAVDSGKVSPDVMKALNQLSGEGVTTQSRTNGRLMNNFPDIRRRACLALGKVKTEESKNYLVSVALSETEPMVISAAVSSLGDVGINNKDEVIDAIAFATRRNQILNPTSSLASEVIDCFAKLEKTTENKKIITDSLTRIASDYHYVKPVREKALKLLKQMNTSSRSEKASE